MITVVTSGDGRKRLKTGCGKRKFGPTVQAFTRIVYLCITADWELRTGRAAGQRVQLGGVRAHGLPPGRARPNSRSYSLTVSRSALSFCIHSFDKHF